MRLRSITSLLVLTIGCAATHAAFAQDYSAKPVRIIEPFGAGGGPDLLARALAPKLSELWGQPVTVDNHPGRGPHGGPCIGREVAGRRIHTADQHQRSGIQRGDLEKSSL